MAVKVQKVVGDLGSEEFQLLRKEFNKLLDILSGMTGSDDLGDLADAVDAGVTKIVESRELPDRPKTPAV